MGLDKELVVARFQEDIDWVIDSPTPTTIYNKGPALVLDDPNIEVIDLPNRGREAGTWVEHICRNYDSLASWTYFVQGRPHCPIDELWCRIGIDYPDTTPLTAEYLPNFPDAKVKALDKVKVYDGIEVHWGLADHHGDRSPEINRPWLDATWRQWFSCPRPDPQWFGYGASFAVPRNRITDRPRDYWLWMGDLLNRDDNERDQTPQSAYAMETIWAYLWGPSRIYPVRKIPGARNIEEPIKTGCGCGSRPKVHR